MNKSNFISPLENVDLYGLILSMLGNCCRQLVFFLKASIYQNTLGFMFRVSNVLD